MLESSVIQRFQAGRIAAQEALGSRGRKTWRRGDDLARATLEQARQFQAAVESGKVDNYTQLQEGLGRSKGHLYRFKSMLKLPADVCEQIDQGVGRHLTKRAIARICQGKDPQVHAQVFAQECATATQKHTSRYQQAPAPDDTGNPWVQVTVVFNPSIWKLKREAAQTREAKLRQVVAQQNRRLATGAVTAQSAAVQVGVVLAQQRLSQCYQVRHGTTEAGKPRIDAVRDPDKWQRARARDGFHVVVASPDVQLTAVQQVELYRSKDKIEKDFREIKSVLELRPVRHRTDVKVRAHVTLCILALAVQRWLEQRLRSAGRNESAAAALEQLRCLRLCGMRLPDRDEVFATPTAATAEQRALAEALRVDWALTAADLSKKIIKTHT